MPSLKTDFDELLRRIQYGREFAHASFEPIFYFVFHPSEMLEVKRQLPAWIARLRNDGWNARTFSIAEAVRGILSAAPLRGIWLEADRRAPLDWARTNKSLANTLMKNGQLQTGLAGAIADLEGQPASILLVTDLEALHPYLRIGALEAQLQGRFHVPTIFFYPGTRTGKTRLRFLGFYPEDGNYRSVHVGG